MPLRPLLRALVPVLATGAALVFVACGGSAFDSGASTEPVQPGDPCAASGARAPSTDGCNDCTCADGRWACTEKACPAGDGGSPPACVPGDARTAADGCNSCSCTEEGAWVCTVMACPPPPPPPPPPSCVDGASRTAADGCNTCTCSGGQWGCTEMACPPPACQDGEQRYDGCNTCTCSGGQWLCTGAACPPPECQSGDVKVDGCRRCTCNGGWWMCDAAACLDGGSAEVGCGARLGDTCSSAEYCAYEEGDLCGAADASSVCRPRPEGCTREYAPVCGCDGETYGNTCNAAAAGTGVLHSGPC